MFKNLVALVTGGAGGLGRATATRLVNKGSQVVICDLPSSNGAEVAKDLGENAFYVPTDVTSEEQTQCLIDEISKKYGKLNVVVNCAGLSNAFVTYNFLTKKPRSLKDFENVLMTNVVGTTIVSGLAAGLISQNKPDADGLRGVVINTSGVEAFNAASGQVATAAAAGAIHSLTKTHAIEFAPKGIRVVAIAPGMIRTKLTDHFPEDVEEEIATECIILPNRLGYPDEFAQVVQTIVVNPYINATTIELSGGLRFSM